MNNDIVNIIFDRLRSAVEFKLLNSADISLKNSNTNNITFVVIQARPSPWRGEISDKTLAKIKSSKISGYVSFKNKYKSEFEKYNIPFNTIKSEQTIRIKFEDFLEIDEYILKNLINTIFIDSFNFTPFGCCGKFKECQLKHECLHEDIIYATACQWRKLIENQNK